MLPLFSKQKAKFGQIEGLGMTNFGMIYDRLVYFTVFWLILCPSVFFCGHFGILCGHLVFSVVIWYSLWSFGILCGHFVFFVVIWYSLWSFGIFFVVIWYISSRFLCQEKPDNPHCLEIAIRLLFYLLLWTTAGRRRGVPRSG
jgi:hypothetical protein